MMVECLCVAGTAPREYSLGRLHLNSVSVVISKGFNRKVLELEGLIKTVNVSRGVVDLVSTLKEPCKCSSVSPALLCHL